MKKSIFWLIGLLFSASLAVTSCSETEGAVDPYFNWEERNQVYIDSIATVAKANPAEWKVIHSYKFEPTINDLNPEVGDYVYCRVIENGTGTVKPLYTDSVDVHYRGWLIPLYNGAKVIFDQSFQGELNPEIAISSRFAVDGTLVEGWKTVLQQMVVGDRWEIYIPQELGYGTFGQSDIPGYSTLIFDVTLAGIETNR